MSKSVENSYPSLFPIIAIIRKKKYNHIMNTHFNENTFDDDKILSLLGKDVLTELQNARLGIASLSKETTEKIALSLQKWALDKGATHYTHWFHPLGTATAEKLLPLDGSSSYVNSAFNATSFLNSESDASSFPSGGLRSTFEARGLSTWDYSSPAFLKKVGSKLVLYVPTLFISPHGETLDKKMPLLRSIKVLQNEVSALLKTLDGKDHTIVNNVGVEQEFFLVEKDKLLKREDLSIIGRTIFGTENKNLQFNSHHYSASISERIGKFFDSLNDELEKLGIVPCAEHQEASPNQFEVALMYAPGNIMIDHNQILMDTIKTVAEHYNLAVLFDEKPFSGVNGSGKHTNWSISADGENLFTPGKNGEHTLRFLLFLSIFVRAIDRYSSLLLSSIASRSNEFRLGKNEAPPMVISMFLGDKITSFFEKSKDELKSFKITKSEYDSDRNRTSPLAFTNGKFEFRAVGSSQSISSPVAFINTAFAESTREATKRLSEAKDKNTEIINIIKDFWDNHSKVVYNGNGYSKEWEKESSSRSLLRITNALEGFDLLNKKENIDLLTSYKIFTPAEIESRINVSKENYIKTVLLECSIASDMLYKHIIPASLKSLDLYYDSPLGREITALANSIKDVTDSLSVLTKYLAKDTDVFTLIKALDKLKNKVAILLPLISAEYLTIPSYDELLLSV